MSDANHVYQRIQKIEEVLRQLQKKSEMLEMTLNRLQNDLTQLKQEPRNIEYNFDQLKIDTLEGTLNIGLSSGGGFDDLEDFTVNGKAPNIGNQPINDGAAFSNDFYQWMNQCVDRYLTEEVFEDIRNVEKKVKFTVHPTQHKVIVDDIKQQMGMRLPHYVMVANPDNVRSNPHVEGDRIMKQVKKDIMDGIEIYLNHERQKRQGGNHNGT
jgi:spore germination protein PC